MKRLIWLAAVGACACAAERPDDACASNADCESGAVCVSGTCASTPALDDPGAEAREGEGEGEGEEPVPGEGEGEGEGERDGPFVCAAARLTSGAGAASSSRVRAVHQVSTFGGRRSRGTSFISITH